MPPNPFDDRPSRATTKVVVTDGLLIAANLTAWLWAWLAFADRPALLGIAFLAYVFGLRHAFDADHIAAIDNVVRKLMQRGKAPYCRRLLLLARALHHRVARAVAIAATATALQEPPRALHAIGGTIGTLVSALFLLAIGDGQPVHSPRRVVRVVRRP